MLSFTMRRSSRSAAISCRTGATTRHGAHHGAQKSTSTGVSDSMTSAWKLVSVTSRISAMWAPRRLRTSESIASVWSSARGKRDAPAPAGSAVRGEPVEQMRRDRDLDRGGDDEDRNGDRDRDERRRQQLLPAAAAARQHPGGEGEEQREQLGQRVGQDAEHQLQTGE